MNLGYRGQMGPPPAIITQFEPNKQNRNFYKSSDEKNIFTNNPYPQSLNGQRPMQIANPTYDQYIVKPPKANVTHGRIPDIEFINSEDREVKLYPNPSKYVIKLKEVYKNVTSVTLFNACIPNTSYLVNTNNNILHLSITNIEYKLEIPVGDYTASNLAVALETALQTLDVNFTVTLNTLTNKFTMTNTSAFDLLFIGSSEFHNDHKRNTYLKRSIGKIIGFPKQNFTGLLTYTAPNKYNLSSDPYTVLKIRELENVSSNSTHIDRAFAVIPMTYPHNTKNYVLSSHSGYTPYIKYFNPPLARLDRLTIEFKDSCGNTIDFNGIENFMEFRIMSMNNPGKYDPSVVN